MGSSKNASDERQSERSEGSYAGEQAGDTMPARGKVSLDKGGEIEWNETGTLGFSKPKHSIEESPVGVDYNEIRRRSPHVLYKHYDDNRVLLYVGITSRLDKRTAQHRRDSHWFKSIARITTKLYPSYYLAREAEVFEIRTKGPAHNTKKTHNGSARKSKAWATRWMLRDAEFDARRDDAKMKADNTHSDLVVAHAVIREDRKDEFVRYARRFSEARVEDYWGEG